MSPEAEAVGLAQSWNSLSDPALPRRRRRILQVSASEERNAYAARKEYERRTLLNRFVIAHHVITIRITQQFIRNLQAASTGRNL